MHYRGPDTGWHNSGDTVDDICVGNYVIKFNTVYGWEKPANINIEVTEGNTTTATGIYTEIAAKGSVSVTITPPEAIAEGAMWRLTSGPDTSWHASGETISDVCVGTYYVKFKNIYGWIAPEKQTIEITEGSTATASGNYEQITEKGFVSVTITPPEAIAEGAQWRLTAGPDTSWHGSGDVINDICVGNITVKFKNIYGWIKPDNQTITIEANQTSYATGEYELITEFGSISATIEPQGAIDDGAQWRMIVGSDTDWHDSGDVIADVPVGTYKIKYRNIADWTKPDNQTVEVLEGETATTTGVYEPIVQSMIFGVSDVEWGPTSHYLDGEISIGDYYMNDVQVFMAHKPDAIYSGYYDEYSNISFRLSSRDTSNQILRIEIYSVIFDTMQENTLVRTLIENQPVMLDPDPSTGGYSKYFENFTSWDGLDDNGQNIMPGFYKLKVIMNEDNSWNGEVEFGDNFEIIPRRFLRSPIKKSVFRFIGTDLEEGISSGLYPIYKSIPPSPYNYVPAAYPQVTSCDYAIQDYDFKHSFAYEGLSSSEINILFDELLIVNGYINQQYFVQYYGSPATMILPPEFEPYREDIYDILLNLYPQHDGNIWHQFYNLGLSVSEVKELVKEVIFNGYNILVFPEITIQENFRQLTNPSEMNLSPAYDGYKDEIFSILYSADVLNEYGWMGHCWRGPNGVPMYEGPIQHGMQADSLFYFNGVQGGFCICGEPETMPEGECGYCLEPWACYEEGQICDSYGRIEYPFPYWGQGEVPVEVDYYGYIHAPVAGTYKLRLYADDSATMSLGGDLNVLGYVYDITLSGGTVLGTADASNNNTLDTEITLEPGYYPVEINFNNTEGNSTLNLYWNLRSANNQNFIFIDPTFIQESQENAQAFEAFMGN